MAKKEKQVKPLHEMTKSERTWFLIKRNKTAYFMIAPFMILFFIFTIGTLLLLLASVAEVPSKVEVYLASASTTKFVTG